MEIQDKKTYNMNIVLHKVNIFHIYSLYHFMQIKCDYCKLYNQCKAIKHKREICQVAKETEQTLSQFVYGRNCSFSHDEFFVHENNTFERIQIKNIIQMIQRKYIVDENVRD